MFLNVVNLISLYTNPSFVKVVFVKVVVDFVEADVKRAASDIGV